MLKTSVSPILFKLIALFQNLTFKQGAFRKRLVV